jgi:hypothetical protein
MEAQPAAATATGSVVVWLLPVLPAAGNRGGPGTTLRRRNLSAGRQLLYLLLYAFSVFRLAGRRGQRRFSGVP